MPAKVAVIQKPPVLLDRDATIGKAIEAIGEAADAGATRRSREACGGHRRLGS
ncbi:hypothetical protein FG93_03416 [Bosea sp. LC85]|uniref:hypothetical protein n=1 Tax=Bosea sp. LC85 TaxID=1502851 RepID=UPI0004E3DAAD|nr:hypothetical protein [Bosea sp. LC85]KFC69370.1 hypothetical protein FG93_03416 [Bosea sp. LC85]